MAAIQVPVISPDQVPPLGQVRQAPMPEESALIEGQGAAAVGRGLGELAAGISDIAQKAKRSTDQSESLHAYSALSDWRAKNIDAKALQARGGAAKGIADQGIKAYDDVVRQLMGTMSNRDQRDLFGRHAAEDRDLTVKHLLVHEAQQLEIQGKIDYKDGLDHIASDAGLQWKVAGGPEAKLAEGEKVIADRAALEKWSDQQRAQEVRDFRSKAVGAVVLNATANPDDAGSQYASAFLSRYATLKVGPSGEISPDTSGLIDGDVVHKLWSAVRSADIRDEVERGVARVLKEVPPNKITGIVDIDAQMKWIADNVPRGDVAQRMRDELRQLAEQSRTSRREQDKALSGSVQATIDAGQLSGRIPSLAELEADPRFQGAGEEGRAAMLRTLVSANDSMRVRANSYDQSQLKRRQIANEANLDRFAEDLLVAEPDWQISNIKTREDLSMVLKNYPGLTLEGQAKAIQFAQVVKRTTTEKLPFKLGQYVDVALRRAYPGSGDQQTRDQLRGPLGRALIEYTSSVPPTKSGAEKDKMVRDFLREQLNNRTGGVSVGGFSFGGRLPFQREEEELEHEAERGY